MAQILAPSTQMQMRITKASSSTSPLTSKMWSSIVLKQSKRVKGSSKYKVLTVKSEHGTINRLEDLLNLDITPFTDKIIAEYIWYFPSLFYQVCFSPRFSAFLRCFSLVSKQVILSSNPCRVVLHWSNPSYVWILVWRLWSPFWALVSLVLGNKNPFFVVDSY